VFCSESDRGASPNLQRGRNTDQTASIQTVTVLRFSSEWWMRTLYHYQRSSLNDSPECASSYSNTRHIRKTSEMRKSEIVSFTTRQQTLCWQWIWHEPTHGRKLNVWFTRHRLLFVQSWHRPPILISIRCYFNHGFSIRERENLECAVLFQRQIKLGSLSCEKFEQTLLRSDRSFGSALPVESLKRTFVSMTSRVRRCPPGKGDQSEYFRWTQLA
jgi:hypothetical protein